MFTPEDCFMKNKNIPKYSPVGFVMVAEIVHVAASGWILSILRLSCFSISNL